MEKINLQALRFDYSAKAEECLLKAEKEIEIVNTFCDCIKGPTHPLSVKEFMPLVETVCRTTSMALRYIGKNLDQIESSKNRDLAKVLLRRLDKFSRTSLSNFQNRLILFSTPHIKDWEGTNGAIPFVFQETKWMFHAMFKRTISVNQQLAPPESKGPPFPKFSDESLDTVFELALSLQELSRCSQVCKLWERVILEITLPKRFSSLANQLVEVTKQKAFFRPEKAEMKSQCIMDAKALKDNIESEGPFATFYTVKEFQKGILKCYTNAYSASNKTFSPPSRYASIFKK